jgi:hypothetical protein
MILEAIDAICQKLEFEACSQHISLRRYKQWKRLWHESNGFHQNYKRGSYEGPCREGRESSGVHRSQGSPTTVDVLPRLWILPRITFSRITFSRRCPTRSQTYRLQWWDLQEHRCGCSRSRFALGEHGGPTGSVNDLLAAPKCEQVSRLYHARRYFFHASFLCDRNHSTRMREARPVLL